MKIVLISPSCSKCRELLERNAVFRQFISEVNHGKGMIVVGEEAYLYGFDYTFSNIFFGRVSYETPSVIDLDTFDIVAVPEFSVKDFVAMLKKLPRVRISGKSEGVEETGSSRSGRRSSRRGKTGYNEFVARKQLKKDLKKIESGCVGDVCVEV
jgi:hypothetical protein